MKIPNPSDILKSQIIDLLKKHLNLDNIDPNKVLITDNSVLLFGVGVMTIDRHALIDAECSLDPNDEAVLLGKFASTFERFGPDNPQSNYWMLFDPLTVEEELSVKFTGHLRVYTNEEISKMGYDNILPVLIIDGNPYLARSRKFSSLYELHKFMDTHPHKGLAKLVYTTTREYVAGILFPAKVVDNGTSS